MCVWQKLAPLVVLVRLVDRYLVRVIVGLGCLGSLVGGLGGMRQTQVRALVAYSSIRHGGWLAVGGIYTVVGMAMYFFLYSFIRLMLFYYLSLAEAGSYCGLLKGFSGVAVKDLQLLGLMLVTLAGLPPTVGFAIKWCLFAPISLERVFVSGVLILGSLLGVYFYRCLGFC